MRSILTLPQYFRITELVSIYEKDDCPKIKLVVLTGIIAKTSELTENLSFSLGLCLCNKISFKVCCCANVI